MGQGTESCGGYELTYEPHVEAFEKGCWVQKGGIEIPIREMSVNHLRGAIRIAEQFAENCTFSGDVDNWTDILECLRDELYGRNELPIHIPVYTDPSVKLHQRGSKIEMVCHCGNHYDVRKADIKRGYGKSCCKRCASIKRSYGRKDPRCAKTGKPYNDIRKMIKKGEI